MSLSVCLIASAPPARVAAVLAPVRELADEVVIAGDSRCDEATLAGYAALADRCFRLEFRLYERHLDWLHAQCSGDWILRLDDDEVPSAALVARLPALLAARDVRQYWIARAWLFGTPASVLEDAPWSVDFNNRLVRNDGSLRFGGLLHSGAEPARPCEYVEDPIYHLELVLARPEARRDKAVRYEVANPLLIAEGGGRMNEAFYLPELRRSPRTRPVPAADRGPVERLAGVATSAAAPVNAAGPPTRGGAIELVGPPPVLAPGEGRTVLFRFTNETTERWPADPDSQPAIRASYHWLHRNGSVHTADGLRTGFTRDVRPGERILVPLAVYAPAEPGRYILEADLVHEQVRWFGQGCRVEVEVVEGSPLPPAEPRLRESSAPPRWRRRRALIPRRLHRVWVGPAEMPAAFAEYGRGFERLHPEWEMRLWTDDDLDALGITDDERRRARSASELSNLVRYEVLRRFGGVYVDTDFEPRRPLDDLLGGVRLFAALELPGRVACGVVGAVPGHRTLERAARLSRQTVGLGLHSADATGPYFLTLLFEQEPEATIFGADKFYPYRWDEPERAGEPFPDAYAVHHWALSWRAEQGVG